MNNLLIEIGTEEIPAGYIKPALEALAATLSKKLTDARITYGQAKTYGTPRRLAILVDDVAERQTSLIQEVTGPPEKVGIDGDGKPTVAAIKFAEKIGVSVDDIQIVQTEKGRYLAAQKKEDGAASVTILKTILPDIILSLPFPKTMKWGDLTILFARPIHSVAAILGKSVISFTLGGIKSGRNVSGHRFMHPSNVRVAATDSYINQLREACVIADIDERRELVAAEVAKAATDIGGKISPDEELMDIVTNLVELPVAVAGTFDTKFLELPKAVLIMSMREHQKYFAVVDETEQLMPYFIAVNNTRATDLDLVAKGHERVLRARLEDARFFYKSDLETPLEHRVEKLKGVLFQAKLGSMYEKVVRIQELGKFIAKGIPAESTRISDVARAAWLCKADLVSQVVVEFPKLQGVMGRVYAALSGETEQVAAAVEEHYRPTYSGGPLPRTHTGAIVAIADKMDSICGCFSVDLIPTGGSDPYALRRQGIGVVQIMLRYEFTFPLTSVIEKSLHLFDVKDASKISVLRDKIYAFLRDRIMHLLVEEGFSRDVVSSVVSVSVDHIPNVWQRVKALEHLKGAADFEPLAAAFKRVVNIIKKADIQENASIDINLFQEKSESALYEAYTSVKSNVAQHLSEADFNQALLEIASLRNTVDQFFDEVLVMAKEEQLRNNRLALLSGIAGLFENIANFSKIST